MSEVDLNIGYGPIPTYIPPEENSQDKKERIAKQNNQLEIAMRKAGIKIEEWRPYA